MDNARAWVRWWRVRGLGELRTLLWDRWDPLDLRGVAPDDEYDSYANVLASKLKRGNSRSDIASYLATTLSGDGRPTQEWVGRCDQTAQDLIEWYAASDAPR